MTFSYLIGTIYYNRKIILFAAATETFECTVPDKKD